MEAQRYTARKGDGGDHPRQDTTTLITGTRRAAAGSRGINEHPLRRTNPVPKEASNVWMSSIVSEKILLPLHRIGFQPEDVNQEKINIYLPTVDYFKAKYQIENIEVIGLLIGARGVIPKFFESFRKTFELLQTLLTS
ncbi:hypothetical protein ANN_20945 [Periplaneta americana]|uniref:Uncharacterized protein n=1 Tax=Periplaneta americana TaxID=6978 RepID=A0ABQ8SE09_PERAM|nr:hypothetical protein ANN_20945 [Periplaneta americana]